MYLLQSLLDDRDSDTFIVRPMKDFTNKEVAMYNLFNGLDAQILATFTTKVNLFVPIKVNLSRFR